MTYNIISIREEPIINKFVYTTVLYTFDDGKTVLVEVVHYNPTDSDIINGIENRGITEEIKLNS